MAVLIKESIKHQICDELSKSKKSILIISAFCKLTMIKEFDEYIVDNTIEKILVIRLRPEDIISKASDLELYPYCKKNGWKLFFRLDLHAKTYVFDNIRCIIGSANATQSGMSFGKSGNFEMAATCILSEKDVNGLKSLLKGALEIDDNIYERMVNTLELYNNCKTCIDLSWPSEIIRKIKPDYSLLFSEDFPLVYTPYGATNDDLLFINGNSSLTEREIKYLFENSKCYNWLKELLANAPNNELYFGAITANLHNILLDEPKPYRRDVKILLSNLLKWIEFFHCKDFTIDCPNHSQRVRFNSKL